MLVGIGTLGIVGILYFFVISGQRAARDELKTKISGLESKVSTADRWAKRAPAISENLEANKAILRTHEEAMAPLDKFKWFYTTLDQFVASYGVTLVDISREPAIGEVGLLPKFPYQAAIFAVKASAYYRDFGKFLADFENKFPYMRVQNIKIQPEAGARMPAPVGTRGTTAAKPASANEKVIIEMKVVTLIKPVTPL